MAFTPKEQGQMLVNMAAICHHYASDENFKAASTEELTFSAGKLASMKASTIDLRGTAEKGFDDAEREYKATKARVFEKLRAESKSASDAQVLLYMDDEVLAASVATDKAKASYNKLRSFTADVHDLIETIRSRTIELNGSRKDETIGT